MKTKKLVLTVGTVMLAVAAYAQGTVKLNNYDNDGGGPLAGGGTPYCGIFLGTLAASAPLAGTSVSVLYSLTGTAGSYLPLASFNLAGNPTSWAVTDDSNDNTVSNPLPNTGGSFFDEGYATVPGSTGSETGVFFEIMASYNGNTGYSAPWSQTIGPVIPPIGSPSPATLMVSGPTIIPVPEPSTRVLAGLGALSLLAIRRRK
jgi:hypothetical protein